MPKRFEPVELSFSASAIRLRSTRRSLMCCEPARIPHLRSSISNPRILSFRLALNALKFPLCASIQIRMRLPSAASGGRLSSIRLPFFIQVTNDGSRLQVIQELSCCHMPSAAAFSKGLMLRANLKLDGSVKPVVNFIMLAPNGSRSWRENSAPTIGRVRTPSKESLVSTDAHGLWLISGATIFLKTLISAYSKCWLPERFCSLRFPPNSPHSDLWKALHSLGMCVPCR